MTQVRPVPSIQELVDNWYDLVQSLYISFENLLRIGKHINPYDEVTFRLQAPFFEQYRHLLARDIILNLAKFYHGGRFEDLSFPRFIENYRLGHYDSDLASLPSESAEVMKELVNSLHSYLSANTLLVAEIVESRNKAHAHKDINDLSGSLLYADIERMIILADETLRSVSQIFYGKDILIRPFIGQYLISDILAFCSMHWERANQEERQLDETD